MNVAPGFASLSCLGLNKALAVREKLAGETGTVIDAVQHNFTRQLTATDVVIVTVDSMEKRRRIWGNRERIESWKLWIDARMGKDQA